LNSYFAYSKLINILPIIKHSIKIDPKWAGYSEVRDTKRQIGQYALDLWSLTSFIAP
jgi:hypothetical protein